MAGPCVPTLDRLADSLGGNFSCESGNAFVNIRAPWDLTNWTLFVVEALLVGGMVYAFVHAVRRWRAGDPTVLALCVASIVYLFVIEPPLYFPDQIGVTGQTELVFAHNVFTVQLMWDRLPLYIVALYPAMITLAYEIVRSVGVFRRHGVLIGGACVGFVHHCFYEVFDHLGPQLQWWYWNQLADPNHPSVEVVPLSSVVLFATVAPAALAAMVYWLVGRKVDAGERVAGWSLVGRTALAGLLMLLASVVGGLPWSVFNTDDPNAPAQIAALLIELAVFAVIGLIVLPRTWVRSRAEGFSVDDPTRRYVLVWGSIYLATFLVLWMVALPDHLAAVDGVTSDGVAVGSLAYAAGSFALAAGAVALAVTTRSTGQGSDPVVAESWSGPDGERTTIDHGRGTISRVSSASSPRHLDELVALRRARDRMDREYDQPLDVDAIARGVNMSSGHFGRQFKRAYGESPYSHLMTRRIERAMALLRRGDLSVTDVCFAVGCSSLGTFSTRFTELVGIPPSEYRKRAAEDVASISGIPSCIAKKVTRPVRNREAR